MKKFNKRAMSIASVAAILASIVAMPVSAAGINAYSVSYETLTTAITTEDGSTVPAGAVAVTMSIENNTGFDSNTITLDISDGCEVVTNNLGMPILEKGNVLENALVGSAVSEENRKICVTTAMSEFCETNGDLFTVYVIAENASYAVNEWIAEETINGSNLDVFSSGGMSTFSRPIPPYGFEYRAGDCDNNNSVDANDATYILQVMEQTGNEDLRVSDLWVNYLYLTYFPSILVPEQADADGNTYINEDDATVILRYAAEVAAGNTYTGSGCLTVGQWFLAVYQ